MYEPRSMVEIPAHFNIKYPDYIVFGNAKGIIICVFLPVRKFVSSAVLHRLSMWSELL